jgi:cell volume regulation protein A
MIFTFDNIILTGSILLLLGIFSTKISKYGIPVVFLFILLGMFAGSEGIGGIYFDDPKISKFIGMVSLSFILFSGGLTTKLIKTKNFIRQSIALSTLGVAITAGIIGLVSHFLFGYGWIEGLLLGSIVSSTDAAAIFPLLRGKNLDLKGHLRNILEFESGSNDPMAYFLTILFISFLTLKIGSWSGIVIMFFQQMIFGSVIGISMGYISQKIINRINLDFEGLYSVLMIAFVFFTFSFTDFVGGNSFLAVYLLGITLGNKEFIHKKSLIKHFDGQAWFMQMLMFLTLGLLVFPSQLLILAKTGLLLSLILIFVARPIAVFLSLVPFRINSRSKLFISWAGLRGSVPIILAIYVRSYQLEISNLIFNLVFFISLTSVLIQGTTLPIVARWLHVLVPPESKRLSEFDLSADRKGKRFKSELTVGEKSAIAGKKIVDLHIPGSVMITWIKRNGRYLTHDGNFEVQENDILEVISDSEEEIHKLRLYLKIPIDVESRY